MKKIVLFILLKIVISTNAIATQPIKFKNPGWVGRGITIESYFTINNAKALFDWQNHRIDDVDNAIGSGDIGCNDLCFLTGDIRNHGISIHREGFL